jgi:Holliday junction resolvase-like predicted endonuclease
VKTNWHIATAAEAIAAAQFARLGFSVSVQYGANQPEYDLIVENGARPLKISVKGSANGGWGLSQSQLAKLKNANYKGAADEWLARHRPGTVICLVQFQNAKFEEMPRIYLATPHEIAAKLREASGGRGDTVLWENYTRGPKARGAGNLERLPDEWRLTESRVNDLLLI